MKEYLKNSDYRSVLITVLFVIFGSSFAFSAVPLDEWTTNNEERLTHINEKGEQETTIPENHTTWIFEDGTFIPMAKLQGEEAYSIITDHLGTPTEAYDEEGEKVWSRELNIYGETRKEFGVENFIPFLYQGQYLDVETDLAYNRYRYYSPESGTYVSQDPIGLSGGMPNMYSYVSDSNSLLDPHGLMAKGINVSMNSALVDVPARGVHVNVADGKSSMHVEVEGFKNADGTYGVKFNPADPTAKGLMEKSPSKWKKITDAVSDFVSNPKNSTKLANVAQAASENFPNNTKDFKTTAEALRSGCS